MCEPLKAHTKGSRKWKVLFTRPEAHKMGMQISCGVHPEIPQETVVSRTAAAFGGRVPGSGPTEGKPG